MKVEVPDWLVYVLAVAYLSFLSLYTGLAVACDIYGSPLRSVSAVGRAKDIRPTTHSYAFTFVLADNRTVGRYITATPPQENETLILMFARDAVRLPLIYEGRFWIEVWSGKGDLLYTSEPHTPLYFSLSLWLASTFCVTVILVWRMRKR